MGVVDTQQIKNIENSLGDDLSKDIFRNRLMFSLTNDYKYIKDVACTVEVVNRFYKRIKEIEEPIGVFGAGRAGRRFVKVFNDIKWACFIDNYKAGTVYENMPVISLAEFEEKYPNGYIVIMTRLFFQDIWNQLLDEGYEVDHIINVGEEHVKLGNLQYFDLPQLKEKSFSHEVFVDGGCYDGSTSVEFIKWNENSGGCPGYVYAWEPNPKNMEQCEKKFKDNGIKYTMIPKGLWNESGTLSFAMRGAGSRISAEGDININVDSMDDTIKEEVTFIKMDIEGSEYQAIQGARKTIEKYRPRLAICIYHKPEDIWELPALIHEIDPTYKFYLRHYSFNSAETVLYAL
jgi:FkbM family methyltransferase